MLILTQVSSCFLGGGGGGGVPDYVVTFIIYFSRSLDKPTLENVALS